MLTSKVKDVLKDDIRKIRYGLRHYKGIIEDVAAKEQQIHDDLQNLVDMSTKLKPLRTRIRQLIDEFQINE